MSRAGTLAAIVLALVTMTTAQEDFCSLHQGLSCHRFALCKEDATRWWCECQGGSTGDGLKALNQTGCIFEKTPCVSNTECHYFGYCAVGNGSVCNCKEGYDGDGKRNCTDIDECAEGRCSPDATCQNGPGTYTCACNIGFVGNGKQCVRSCELNHHCGGENNFCNTEVSLCECREGYQGNAFFGCTDVDECTGGQAQCGELMYCENLNGTYDCPCTDGYFKVDGKCRAKPRNCNDIKLQNTKSRDGFFEVDPDGPGGVAAFEVYCDFQPTYGITVIFSEIPDGELVRLYKQTKDVTYTPSTEQITALIDSSNFCYQDMKFKCETAQKLLNGDTYWIDRNGGRHFTWGGSTKPGKCLCGELQVCGDPNDNCYCNGQDANKEDRGRIFDRSILPIKQVIFGGVAAGQKSNLKIGNLKCGPQSFDIAESCHEYKLSGRYWIRKDTPMFIDVDGPDGECEPMLAHCIMERYKNVGVTVFYHDKRNAVTLNQAGRNVLTYNIPKECLKKAVDGSEFCIQSASYQCKNSRLYNNGDLKGFMGDLDGNTTPYFAGGMGVNNMCGCGLSGSCDSPNVKCNCDIMDGEERIDLGVIREKEYLPIGFLEFNEIGGNASGTYEVGPLMCSEKQFGIPPSCLAARADGHTDSYNYLIDPDQGVDIQRNNNVEPFNVYCKFNEEGISATTIVYHENSDQVTLSAEGFTLNFKYYLLAINQIEALKRTSSFCYQNVDLNCFKSRIHVDGLNHYEWTGVNGDIHKYFHGNGGSRGCACNDVKNCTNELLCNCDNYDEFSRLDFGFLTNMNDIPVGEVVLRGLDEDSIAYFNVGPLTCSENYPTCAQLNSKFIPAEKAFGTPPNGEFFIDPDGVDPLEPFLVKCAFPFQTILPIDAGSGQGRPFPRNGIQTCFDVAYSGDTTPEQIQALVNSSAFCEQRVSYFCKNSPFTGKISYKTCDGRVQNGWGGSQGQPGCGCGVTGTCDKCLCDNSQAQTQKDYGFIRAKYALPVCEVCFDLDPVPFGEAARYSKVVIDELVCYPHTGHLPGTCQDVRNDDIYHTGESEITTEVDPDGSANTPPLPVTCVLSGLTGVVVIQPLTPVIEVPLGGLDIQILYFFLNFTFIRDIVEDSVYCEQSLRIECFDGASFEMNTNSAWQSSDGTYKEYWGGNTGGIGCKDGVCNCGFQDGRERIDGGLLTDQDTLPVTGIKLPQSDGPRRVSIGALKCYVVYKDCDDILKNTGGDDSPSGGKIWPIDPDGAGGVEPFVVECDFYSHKHMGITVVRTQTTDPVDVTGAPGPGDFDIPVDYLPTPEQINALTSQSEYCYQNVELTCAATPLINDNDPAYGYLTLFNNTVSPNFAAGDSSLVGCACELSGTCPAGQTCRCDSLSSDPVVERGVLLNEEVMPITKASFGGQTDPSSTGTFKVGDVLCAPEVFDVPTDCEEARQLGVTTGDTLIRPNRYLPPIMVYCEMRKAFGITIVGTSVTNIPGNVTYPGKVEVDYFDATELQLRSLAQMSICQQPVKYDCKNTQFLANDKAYWKSMSGTDQWRYWGHANPWEIKCSCGHDKLCGGTPEEGKFVQRSRRCNCDTNDDVWRSDAGILSQNVPVSEVVFGDLPEGAEGKLSVGYLYCAPEEFDLDECEIDFHDCSPQAECINLPGAFECRCKEGFRGWGLDRTRYYATGRVCYDDDECALNKCGFSATCENTPGSYKCHCKDGYTQDDDQTCTDVNECETGDEQCDPNANCINVPGSYLCRCNRGFQGDGRTCAEVGICTCFGDPHCRSFDDRWLHFQGACQYTMAQDKCDGTEPTFQVLQKSWRRDDATAIRKKVSWVKEVTIIIGSLTLSLKQGLKLFVNGIDTNLPNTPAEGVIAYYTFQTIEVRTSFGLHVKWNGKSSVDVILPKSFKGKTCGLCGNFNDSPDDDWSTGPRCPPGGDLTLNSNKFGQSWATVAQPEDNECVIDCDAPPDTEKCTDEQNKYAEEFCLIIFSKVGTFKDCLALMSPDTYVQYKASCVYDLCDVGNIGVEICATAENVVSECRDNYNIAITGWRSEAFCDVQCKKNEIFTTCANPSQQQHCVDNSTLAIPGNQAELECKEGCICPGGFMISGTDCVTPDECGCFYDGVYYQANETVVGGGCTELIVCDENKELQRTPAPDCESDKVCAVKNGVTGCYCPDGSIPMDEGGCTDDPCYKNNCTSNSQCVPAEDGYDCICKMGFTGFCNSCSDVDECATKTHQCDGRSKCVNTIGSYQCFCDPGLIALDGTMCIDKNECLLGVDDCDENAQCSNEYKGYKCTCCLGYQEGLNGTCIEVEGDLTGGDCCACVGDDCYRPGPVCGSDFKTYASVRDLVVTACLRENSVTVNYRGECQDGCGTVECEGFKSCREDPGTGLPVCVCDGCTPEQLALIEEVCDEEGNIFLTLCQFRAAMCLTGSDITEPKPIEQCSGVGTGASLTAWTEWSPCSVTCGKGERERTRSWAFGNPSPGVQARVAVTATTECYEPACTTGPCAVDICDGYGEECVEYDGVAQCECPQCSSGGVKYVCAVVGNRVGTFLSACKAQRAACVLEEPYEILHDNICGVKPKECTRMPMFVPYTDGDCYAEGTVNLWTCDGGCGSLSSLCCDSVQDPKGLTIDLKCPDGSSRSVSAATTSNCFCREED